MIFSIVCDIFCFPFIDVLHVDILYIVYDDEVEFPELMNCVTYTLHVYIVCLCL